MIRVEQCQRTISLHKLIQINVNDLNTYARKKSFRFIELAVYVISKKWEIDLKKENKLRNPFHGPNGVVFR